MYELIFGKSQKNLKKVYNRLKGNSVAKYVNQEEVLFLAIGGYNRTYELLLAMGVQRNEIATFSNLTLSTNFLIETHMKKVVYIKKLNYVTAVNKGHDYSRKYLDINIADAFEESMLLYRDANRTIRFGKEEKQWVKPTVVILDDQSLNLQYEGHRFYYQSEIGFVQVRNRNVDPWVILDEIKDVEEAKKMMFVLYQEHKADESVVLDVLNKLRLAVVRQSEGIWYMKPTEFKKVVGSNELVNSLKDIPELNIQQLQSNKKIGKENARWITIPDEAFNFKGFDYKDEEEVFHLELEQEKQAEAQQELEQERLLHNILFKEFAINIKIGYVGSRMHHSQSETLHSFLADIDDVEQDQVNGIELLNGATTEEEYKHIKKYHLAYFLDGEFENNERSDNNYRGGKRLISIDIDEGDYARADIEAKLEQQQLFGLVYPTAKHYFDQSARWRIILMADESMSKETYRHVVTGVAKMLDLSIDESSKKISQLMGYPLASKDVSTVIGTMVNVSQFKQKENVIDFKGAKSLLDFNHAQATLMKEALEIGIPKGRRNDSYRQIIMFLRDTLANETLSHWHDEARELEMKIREQMVTDGLPMKEVELICR